MLFLWIYLLCNHDDECNFIVQMYANQGKEIKNSGSCKEEKCILLSLGPASVLYFYELVHLITKLQYEWNVKS